MYTFNMIHTSMPHESLSTYPYLVQSVGFFKSVFHKQKKIRFFASRYVSSKQKIKFKKTTYLIEPPLNFPHLTCYTITEFWRPSLRPSLHLGAHLRSKMSNVSVVFKKKIPFLCSVDFFVSSIAGGVLYLCDILGRERGCRGFLLFGLYSRG